MPSDPFRRKLVHAVLGSATIAATLFLQSMCSIEQWSYSRTGGFDAPEARQGVAADAEFLYVIDDREIGKYRKVGGERVGTWRAPESGSVVHLNGGTVVGDLLYCAHSNYPKLPMQSSIEIFRTSPLEHVESHALGETDGSLTWLEKDLDRWLACFAHYSGRGGVPGRDASCSRVVELDDAWQPSRQWSFPATLIARFDGYSSSGGAVGPGRRLYVTGHDRPELYVLSFPSSGSVLEWSATIQVDSAGQGLDWDPERPDVLYSIGRSAREVIVGSVGTPR